MVEQSGVWLNKRYHITSIGIPITKIRWSHASLIFVRRHHDRLIVIMELSATEIPSLYWKGALEVIGPSYGICHITGWKIVQCLLYFAEDIAGFSVVIALMLQDFVFHQGMGIEEYISIIMYYHCLVSAMQSWSYKIWTCYIAEQASVWWIMPQWPPHPMRWLRLLQLPGRSFMHHWSGCGATYWCGAWPTQPPRWVLLVQKSS